jgi:hypothetical protein
MRPRPETATWRVRTIVGVVVVAVGGGERIGGEERRWLEGELGRL